MIEYKTPSWSVHQSRRTFHSNQRCENESTSEWFQRLFDSITDCEFGEWSDFMFIDKFIAGLNDEQFRDYASNATLSITQIVATVMVNKPPDSLDPDFIEPGLKFEVIQFQCRSFYHQRNELSILFYRIMRMKPKIVFKENF